MLDQIFNIVKQFGQDTVVDNPDVPNEHNNEVLADATKTITSGFQNVLAGGGFQNILDLFKGGGSNAGSGGGISGLLKNPMVTMMVGYFISKLVGKYKMAPASASNVANSLIPNALNGIINQTNDPNNAGFTLDGLIGSLTGGQQEASGSGGFSLQNLLEQFTGGGNADAGGNSGGGFDLQDIIGGLTQKAQGSFENQSGGGGLMDLIKGFIK
ncbi:MAG TPA: hypothetical protein PKA77_02050 [Chitinophagaceae bacterium]|mgnify:FL=1|jgi:hypothetical protein|nr:hypothetical protein [Chitinophagaceae bacterium]HMU58545.1 hypothetical protein [Chitinophagaceae bacterium]